MLESLILPKKCPRCGKEIPPIRVKMGFPTCKDCSSYYTSPYGAVDVSSSSLHWI